MVTLSLMTSSAFSRMNQLRVTKASQSKLPQRPSRFLHLLSSRLHLPFRPCTRSQSFLLRISPPPNRCKQLHLPPRLSPQRKLYLPSRHLLRNPIQMDTPNPSRKLQRHPLQLRLKNQLPLSPNLPLLWSLLQQLRHLHHHLLIHPFHPSLPYLLLLPNPNLRLRLLRLRRKRGPTWLQPTRRSGVQLWRKNPVVRRKCLLPAHHPLGVALRRP